MTLVQLTLIILVGWIFLGVLIFSFYDIVEFFEKIGCQMKKGRIASAIKKENYIYLSKVTQKLKKTFAAMIYHSWSDKIYDTECEIADALCNSVAKEFRNPKFSLSLIKEKHKRYAIFLYNNLFRNVDFPHSKSKIFLEDGTPIDLYDPKDSPYYVREEFLKYILSALDGYFTSDYLQNPEQLAENASLFYMLVYMISTDEDPKIGPLIIGKYMESLRKWKSAKIKCPADANLLALYKDTIDLFENYEENNPDFYHRCLEEYKAEVEGLIQKLQKKIKNKKNESK